MTKNIVVSIIIPCYNSESHLNRCIASILTSSYKEFELLIVNDGSTDNTKKVISKFKKENRIKIINLNNNIGPARARNIGVKKSTGKYLFFLDIDTEIFKDTLYKVVSFLNKNEHIGALSPMVLNKNLKTIDAVGHYLTPFGFPYEIGVGSFIKQYSKQKIIFGAKTAALVVPRAVFQKIGGFDRDYLIYGEDTDLCWRIWLSGKKVIYFSGARLVHYQKSSLTNSTRRRVYYEGSKNNLSNIIKNADVRIVVFMVPLYLLGWILISVKLFIKMDLSNFLLVYKGLFWNIVNLKRILKKRSHSRTNCYKIPTKILFGDINFTKLYRKGLVWLKNV